MTSAELRNALATEPFRPFTLRFGSGRRVEIANPDLVVVSDTGRTAFAYKPGSDGFEIIDILLVESMDFGDLPGTNGHGRRRKKR